MVAGHRKVAERKENFGCGGLQPSELFSPTFPLPDASRSGLNDQALIPQGILGSSEGNVAI
jgi:hypothetical protein